MALEAPHDPNGLVLPGVCYRNLEPLLGAMSFVGSVSFGYPVTTHQRA